MTIKPAVEAFTAKESKLDVLFNNAGASLPPPGSASAQGHELQMATNCLGHYLLTQLLLPTLLHTAESPSSAAVRVIWTSSIALDLQAPKCGIDIADLTTPPPDQQKNYAISRTGNWFLASALAAHTGSKGILSVTQNPGNLKTALLRHAPWILGFVAHRCCIALKWALIPSFGRGCRGTWESEMGKSMWCLGDLCIRVRDRTCWLL